MKIDDTKPQFYFATNQYGVQNAVLFEAETWPVALAQFIKFLRGAGYYIPEDKILINDSGKGEIPAEEYAQDFE